MNLPTHSAWSRRTFLATVGAGVVAAAAACRSGVAAPSRGGSSTNATTAAQGNVEAWVHTRHSPYYIAHRGAGDVYPEHTMPSYQAAVGWGAPAMEVSTSSSADNVLVCMHDLTLDRTTAATGPIKARTWKELQHIGVVQPQLGPKWTTPPLTTIPSFEQVLKAFGDKTVLCVEAKADIDYPLMISLIEKYGLQHNVIVKLFHRSSRIAQAKAAGYPVFVYLGSDDTSAATIRSAARNLDKATDYLGLPTTSVAQHGAEIPDAAIKTGVETGVATWVYPVHRRSEAGRYRQLGVEGIVTSSLQYVSGRSAPATADNWASKAITPGELTRHPDRSENGPSWTGQDELTLDRNGAQQFITLGQLAPLADPERYQLSFDVRWNELPTDLTQTFTLAVGHVDDAYYEHRLGVSNGYHAIYRANGALTIFSHKAGVKEGLQLSGIAKTAIKTGEWMTMRLEVSPSTLVWSRLDANGTSSVVATDSRFRGSYLHIGRSSSDGSLSLRRLRVQ